MAVGDSLGVGKAVKLIKIQQKVPRFMPYFIFSKELESGADSGPWALCLTSLSSIEYQYVVLNVLGALLFPFKFKCFPTFC